MKYVSFEIGNFKGIQKLSFRLDPAGSSIATLVGLNESGKTTILEALSTFHEQVAGSEVGEPLLHTIPIDDVHALIPKGMKANFHGTITLAASLELDARDKEAFIEFLAENGWLTANLGDKLSVTISFLFKDSKFLRQVRTYGITVEGQKKGKGRRKARSLSGQDKELWQLAMRWLAKRIPPVIYYPNFLFEFPDRIYIEGAADESRENRFYRAFIQDVLDALDSELDLTTHVLARAKSQEQSEREALESVLNRLSSKISSLVFDPELSVFKVDNHGRRSVVVAMPQLDTAEKRYYVTIRLKDGDDTYYIRERSLGFRWFFTFLLLTQFRIARSTASPPVFLFDEPASNLHQAAQQRLLKALEQLTGTGGVSVIYTTHSHHLIDPRRLESTFVVRNRALDASSINDDFTASMTDIEITAYRTFVGSYPDQRSYFQPILDVLEYRPGNLENVPGVVMTEGKSDFYLLSLMQRELGVGRTLKFLPGGGAGGLSTPIQLYIAWGRSFVVLLDGDREGREQAKRYLDAFGPVLDGRLLVLSDVEPTGRPRKIEDLLTSEDRLSLQMLVFPESSRYVKKKFHLAVQECLARRISPALSDASRSGFVSVLEKLEEVVEGSTLDSD